MYVKLAQIHVLIDPFNKRKFLMAAILMYKFYYCSHGAAVFHFQSHVSNQVQQ